MGLGEIFMLPVAIQVALGAGYMAYSIGYAGLRRGHSALDAALISFAFGIPAIVAFDVSAGLGSALAAGIAASLSIGCGILWRLGLRRAWAWLMRDLGVHGDDGTASAWDTVIQQSGLTVEQVTVRTRDGRRLMMNSRDAYLDGPHKGLILGTDGSVVMVVEEERRDGEDKPRIPPDIKTENGVRLTYIPASEVTQINLRVD